MRVEEGEGMRLCVVGIGGVGGYFGGRLAHARQGTEGDEVHFLARGEHLRAIRAEGLRLVTSDRGELLCRPASVTDRVEDLPEIDVFLITVKGADLAAAAASIASRVGEETVLLPLLNGVDIRERVRRQVLRGIVLPACVYVSASLQGPGRVVQVGTPGRILLGPDPDRPGPAPEGLLESFRKASIAFEWQGDVYPAIWEKYVFIAPYGLVTARYDKTLGEVYENESLRGLVRKIMEEVRAVAVARGISLPGTVIETSIEKPKLFPREAMTSLHRDIRQGKKRNELDLFGGTILRMGRETGVPTPVTEEVYEALLKKAQ
jgi:2-dehydropantoate 2-reductase